MRLPVSRLFVALVVLALLAAACTGSADSSAGVTGPEGESEISPCQATASLVLERFESFLEPHADLTPEQFLSEPELDGLDEFQVDVSGLVANPNDDCSTPDLEAEVAVALESFAQEGLLEQYLVGAVRTGIDVSARNVVVSPEDDLVALLPLLGDGSSVTFGEGVFTLDASVLVQSELTLVGAGRELTVLRSSAETAALAALAGSRVVIADMSIEHIGEAPASVILVVDASLELTNAGVAGGVANETGEGGSGVVLSRASWETSEQAEANAEPVEQVVISNSVISDSASAGVAVTADYAPAIIDSTIRDNELCGVCFFDFAAGVVQSSVIENNGVGVQASGRSGPDLSTIEFLDNAVAAVLVENESTATISQSIFRGVDGVGIDVQDDAIPTVTGNEFSPHAVAISIRGSSTATVADNTVTGGDVALLVGGTAAPMVTDNRFVGSLVASVLNADESQGTFERNVLGSLDAAGAVIEGTASPRYVGTTIDGGLVGMVFREQSDGQVENATLSDQEVGIEVADEARLTLSESTFARPVVAGVIVSGAGGGSFRDNEFDAAAEIAVQLGGSGETVVTDNVVTGGETGILVTGTSTATVLQNRLEGQNFGVVIGADATPTIEDNEILGARTGALFFGDNSGGIAQGNSIIDALLVGIRVAGQASPTIRANTIFAAVGEGQSQNAESVDADGVEPEPSAVSAAGLLYGDSSGGEAGLNQIFGFVIGVQVADDAQPNLFTNRADGAGVGGVGFLYNDLAAGQAEGNLSINLQLGFQLSGEAAPSLVDNTVEGSTVAAFLVQSAGVPELAGNECPGAPAGIAILEEATPDLAAGNPCPVSR